MSVTPRGMSIQEAYRLYRDDCLLVNRKYQRKLVWSVDEKEYLVDSILSGLPVPLILLAQIDQKRFEVVDGLQRLNAIFSFIENSFTHRNKFFDVSQFARAKQVADAGEFEPETHVENLLEKGQCANYLDYQLAVTIYPSANENEVIEIFGRINSGGKQLSAQERRQAGTIDDFADLVRRLSAEIRGDASQELLNIREMPAISIDTTKEKLGYGLSAEEIFWCKQGILWKLQLRDSEDEEMIADIIASILNDTPIPRSKEYFDELYDPSSETHKKIIIELGKYGAERLMNEVKITFSVLREILDNTYGGISLRSIVNPGSRNPIKASFYAIFMAFFNLLVKEEKSPVDNENIVKALEGLQSDMISTAHYATTEDRIKNMNKTIGLIQSYFVKKDPPVLKHGAGLALDFENSIRRSKVETNRYECKQGFIDLSNSRQIEVSLQDRLIETICAIANLGPDADGYLFIGVADKKPDADRIRQLDQITPIEITSRFVVGINRELKYFNKSIDNYIDFFLSNIQKSQLTEPLKSQALSQIDVVDYKGLTVIRLRIPKQNEISFVGNDCFVRENSKTIKVEGPKLLAISKLFGKK